MAITRTIERTVSLDAMAWRESLPGLAYQGEQNAHQFVIHCTQDGSPLTLTGSVLLRFLRPDGVTVDVPGSVVDGAAVVTLSGNCYAVMGRAEITIFVTQDSATVAVYSANTAVTRTTSGEEISGGDIINLPALQERFEDMADAIDDCEAATAAAEGITDMIAPVESTSTASQAYAVGEYLIYNGALYEVTAAIASGDTLTVGTNIAAVADGLGGEVADLKNAIDEVENQIITGNIPMDKSNIGNQYIKNPAVGSAIAFANSAASVTIKKIITVKQGYNYKVSVKNSDTPAGEGVRDWVITDTSNIVRQVYNVNDVASGTSEIEFTAATEGYLYLCVDKEYVSIEITGGVVHDLENNLDKISSIIEESPLLINLYDNKTYEPGGVSRVNGEVVSNSNIRHSAFIEIKPNTMYILSPEYNSNTYGLAFYDQSKTFVSGLEQNYTSTSNMNPFTFATPSGVKYLRFSIWHTFAESAYLYEWSDQAIKKVFEAVKTEGEPIIVSPESNIHLIYRYSTTTWGSAQGGAIYDDKLFIIGNNLVKNAMFDFNTYTLTAVTYSGATVDNHANIVSFGTAFYDEGDQFPLLYISSERENYCGIFRIVVDNGAYSIVEISRIILPNLSYVNLAVDTENNMAYVRGTPTGDTPKLITYYLPNSFDQNITFEYVPYSEQEHPYGYLASVDLQSKYVNNGSSADRSKQDAFISGGKYFSTGGYRGSANINVNSLEDGSLLSFANISSTVFEEPEVCEAYKNGIIIVTSAGGMYYMKTV